MQKGGGGGLGKGETPHWGKTGNANNFSTCCILQSYMCRRLQHHANCVRDVCTPVLCLTSHHIYPSHYVLPQLTQVLALCMCEEGGITAM